MKISFVIPAYNEEFRIGTCLNSVTKAIKNTPCDAEIIVVNNASTDKTKEIAQGYEGVRVVDETRKGLVWARKAGYEASTGDIVANVDSDTILPDAWLPTVLREFASDPKLLALSGPYIYYDASLNARIWSRIFYILGYLFDTMNQLLFKNGTMLQGGNFILRRGAIEQIGGFDTSIVFHGEDTDLGKRIRKIGKVRWTFSLPMYSSGRRFQEEGMIKTSVSYATNYLSIAFKGKPHDLEYNDIRTPESKG
jgi:glycosyltransferase involved in cell wall biosynthesis